MKILVVDDEQDEEALELPLQEYGLILLDVMMDEMSGFQMARKMKDNPATALIPIIFITALEGEDNMVKGLNIGADDYIAKPLSMKEVKARVRAVLRRASVSNQHPEGKGAFPTSDHQISYEGKLEYEILSLLLQHPGKVFSREDLLKYCWPQDVLVLDRTVDVNITRLRKKIGRYGQQIKTRVGYGYCFEK